jgi:carbonic anhydrase
VELNTVEQVHRLIATSVVQKSWKTRHQPSVHGWVYNMETGYIKELMWVRPGEALDEIYSFD